MRKISLAIEKYAREFGGIPENRGRVDETAGNRLETNIRKNHHVANRVSQPPSEGRKTSNNDKKNPSDNYPENSRSSIKTGNIDKKIITYFKPLSVGSEMFKILKSNILFPPSGSPPKTILITSVEPGEGKSFVAINLAMSLAQNIDEHVLLVDCDLRNPSIHKSLGFGQTQGLSEYLQSAKPVSAFLQKTMVDKLTVFPGGAPPPNPSELISSKRMIELMKELKNRYTDRHIILDSPPPQITAEAIAIAKMVDSIILVVKYRRTSSAKVLALAEKLGKRKILGIVLNRYDNKWSAYRKYQNLYNKYYAKDI